MYLAVVRWDSCHWSSSYSQNIPSLQVVITSFGACEGLGIDSVAKETHNSALCHMLSSQNYGNYDRA